MLSVEIGGVLSSTGLSVCEAFPEVDALLDAEVVDVVLSVLELLASELSLVILQPNNT